MQTHDRRWIKTNYTQFGYFFEQGCTINLITASICAIVIDYFNCNFHGTVQDINKIQPKRGGICLNMWSDAHGIFVAVFEDYAQYFLVFKA